MPLAKKGSKFNKSKVRQETDNYGVYELGNSKGILYIGEGHVKTRLMAHFSDGTEPTPGTAFYRVEYTKGKQRAVQRQNAELSAYKRKHGKYPRFNQRKG